MKKFVLLFFIIGCTYCVQAQAILGILNDTVLVVPDSVGFFQNVSFSFKVINQGDSTFSGSFLVQYSVNDSMPDNLDSFTNNIVILPGDTSSLQISNNHLVTPALYAIGDNIVVIWPVALGQTLPPGDSGTTHVYVDTALGIGDPSPAKNIHAYYDPLSKNILIRYTNATDIAEVSCYSLLGERIRNYHFPVNKISLKEDAPQIFLLVIRTRQGDQVCFKILRR